MSVMASAEKRQRRLKDRQKLVLNMKNSWQIYLLIAPAIIILLWFRYIPMYGLVISLKDYNLLDGITASEWANPLFRHFERAFRTTRFWQALRNTMIINFYRVIFQFPIPIIFALMIDECQHRRYKRVIQTVSYLPHFLSWVIIAGLFNNMLALNTGIVNQIVSLFGGQERAFLSDPSLFRSIVVVADIWRGMGWGTIVILAAVTSVDPALHEAAFIDGAGRLKRIWHVTLPCIKPIIVVLLILRIGAMMSDNVEMILQFYSPTVYDTGDVLGTYIYRVGLGRMEFSFTTAVGFFKAVVNMALMLIAHRGALAMGEKGLW
jgi:putative aldouronate transport system permease protein